jgi:hypothetical protein
MVMWQLLDFFGFITMPFLLLRKGIAKRHAWGQKRPRGKTDGPGFAEALEFALSCPVQSL